MSMQNTCAPECSMSPVLVWAESGVILNLLKLLVAGNENSIANLLTSCRSYFENCDTNCEIFFFCVH